MPSYLKKTTTEDPVGIRTQHLLITSQRPYYHELHVHVVLCVVHIVPCVVHVVLCVVQN